MQASPYVLRYLWPLIAAAVAQAVISPKVLIVAFYGDEGNAWLDNPEFNLLEQNITVPGVSMKFPDVHCTKDGSICQLVAGEGEINAAISTFSLVVSPLFNLTQTYFLLAGDGGINPKVTTIGSVAFAQFAVQVALQYEIDAREKPDDFSSGYIPQGSTTIDSYPRYLYGTEVFQLNDALRQRAMTFARAATFTDSPVAQAYRQQYANVPEFAPALAPPAVVGCDTATSDNWWSGALLGDAFAHFTTLATNGSATYCTTQQEDSGVLEALLRGHVLRRVDFGRVLHMRTGSDFDRPGLGGYEPALRNLYLAGVRVVQGIVAEWDATFAAGVRPQNYIGDVWGSLGGDPPFGPGSIFKGKGALAPPGAAVDPALSSDACTHARSLSYLALGIVLGLEADVETLQQIGHDTVQSIVALVVEAIMWTIYLVLTFKAGIILLSPKRRSRASIWIFIIIVSMFLMDTAISMIDVNNAIREITLTLTSTSSESLADRYELTDNLPWPVQGALYAYMEMKSNLGDVIIIWRTWVFWRYTRERWVLVVPILFLIGSLVTSGLISFCVARVVQDPGASAGDFTNPPFCNHVQLSSYVTTLATTAVSTLMIGYKTWEYRLTIGAQVHRMSSKKTRAERITIILVESGLLYFLFLLEAVVTDSGDVAQLEASTPQLAFASEIWTYMTSHILGIYPVVIVILVHSHKSYIDDTTTTLATAPSGATNDSSPTSSWPFWGSLPKTLRHQTHAVELDALNSPPEHAIRTISERTASPADLRLFKGNPEKFVSSAVV
ncbi:purine nucleoside permease-domain-containing protein [Fomitopsis serialis]|uniref:purine nucleoside permease-domain-containing protein n=1 Tax=Fomitopsis serialis TaxID=139415 RepID=UPI002007C816|nr:purine nucleoside permease-domain-containing protein [Neoantrodia serialis]KAH9923648.1 purine nucleoside permease-domain-containing protein [Neoantrodia serialis]